MPFSYHSHSGQFCHHGYGELEQVVQQAIKKKFKIYGLTEHMPRFDQSELYPEELEVSVPMNISLRDKLLTTALTHMMKLS
jgi:histidinol-phosphatase (PHP family)